MIDPRLLAAFALLPSSGPGTPPAQGDPPKPKLSRFVTDTLFPAVGGPFPIARSYRPPPTVGRYRYPAYTRFQPDTLTTLHEPLTAEKREHLASHEGGHILDARGLAWDVLARVAERRPEYRRRDYFQPDPNEYVAEAFARALESMRRGGADSLQVDKQMPGTIELIRWLQTRPPFAKRDNVRSSADSTLAAELERAAQRARP